jgi:phosphate transport system permease protein
MPVFWIILIVLALAALGYAAGRRRAVASVNGDIRKLHSLPAYYGWNVVVLTLVPALVALLLWVILQPLVIEAQVAQMIPAEEGADGALVMVDVQRIAEGLDTLVDQGALSERAAANLDAATTDIRQMLADTGVALGAQVSPEVLTAAQSYRGMARTAITARTLLTLALAVAGMAFGIARAQGGMRARNAVEKVVMGLLIFASSIAIATTAGIVLSMLFETRNFFAQYDWRDFFFSTTWSPQFQGDSDLGILPLIWGTLYISIIALAFAVPVGLFAAIYMSEYAGRRFRVIVKPMIEILAGIPTIVYGLFALVTVGPMLRDYFAQPLGLGASGSSVMTAGLVMGIMLIPFVSSLSDDIISQVPQSLRDGSLGLGATKSETIRQVILPAALPGIVGAILLAASRAIGETMIVVLGAGAAAKLSLNPFEAMTTVTVKIVSQLTGDTDFAAPETLVAFALGLTLFVITLGLNVLALMIVRKYREQYE